MNYVGDFSEDQTVYLTFNTFTSDDPSASSTITDLVDADIKVHKDGNVTEIVTDGATVIINFDGVTGNHLITIDTSVDAAYSTGSDYFVRINGTTVDGATINAWIGSFSIENRFMRGTDSALLAASVTIADGAIKSDMTHIHGSALTETAGQLAAAFVKLFDVATPLLVASDVMVGTNSSALASVLGAAVGASISADIAAMKAETVLIVEDTSAIQGKLPANKFMGSSDGADDDSTLNTIATDAARLTAARAGVLTDWINGGRLDILLDAIKVVTDLLADSASTIESGTVAATGSSTTIFYSDDITEATTDHYKGRIIIFTTSGVGTDQLVNQATEITGYELSGGEGKFTVTALTEAPSNNDTFVIV